MVTQVQHPDYDQNGLHWSKSADPNWQLYASMSKDSLASPSDIDSKILSMQHFSELPPPASAVSAHQFSKSKFRRADSYKFTLVVRSLLFVLELGTCIYFYAISKSRVRKGEELKVDAALVALIAALLIDGTVVTAVLTKRYHDLWAVVTFIADCGVYVLNLRAMLVKGEMAGWFEREMVAVWMFIDLCWLRSAVWVAGICLCLAALCRKER